MDGASIAAIESHEELRARTTRAPVEAPRHAAVATPVPEPVLTEPEPVVAAAPPAPVAASGDGMLFDAPIVVRPPVTVTPVVKKIVDPMAAGVDDEPLFVPSHYAEGGRQKAGFLRMFGHGRKTPRPVPARGGGAQGAADPLEESEADRFENEQMPSFLRRLAN